MCIFLQYALSWTISAASTLTVAMTSSVTKILGNAKVRFHSPFSGTGRNEVSPLPSPLATPMVLLEYLVAQSRPVLFSSLIARNQTIRAVAT